MRCWNNPRQEEEGGWTTKVSGAVEKTMSHRVEFLIICTSSTSSPEARCLLMGRGSERFRAELLVGAPHLDERVTATGSLDAAAMSRHLSACDLMLQPFADGLSTRRTSAMACLAHGRPVVSTSGKLTEPLWDESNAVRLAPVGDPSMLVQRACDLLKDEVERARLSAAGRDLHRARFELTHTIAALRGDAPRAV